MLTRAGPALIHDRLPHGFPTRRQRLDYLFLAANHDAQSSFPGPDIPTRNRGINAVKPLLPGDSVDFLCQRRLTCRHVNKDAPSLRAVDGSVLTQDDFPNVARKANDGKDDIGTGCNRLRCLRPRGACFEEFSRFGRGPTVHGHLISCRHQMSAHTSPHDARANPTNFCRTRFRRRHLHNYPFNQLKWSSSTRTTASIRYGSPQTIKDNGFLTISGQNLTQLTA